MPKKSRMQLAVEAQVRSARAHKEDLRARYDEAVREMEVAKVDWYEAAMFEERLNELLFHGGAKGSAVEAREKALGEASPSFASPDQLRLDIEGMPPSPFQERSCDLPLGVGLRAHTDL